MCQRNHIPFSNLILQQRTFATYEMEMSEYSIEVKSLKHQMFWISFDFSVCIGRVYHVMH